MGEQNIEIINGIPVDWSLFKSKTKGKYLENSKKGYIGLCESLHNKEHKLFSEYIDAKTKILIDFNCGHKPNWITPSNYKIGQGCPKCAIERISVKAKEKFLKIIESNNHKLLSEYVGAKTKVLIDFNCDHDPNWITPDSYKRGSGCPKCVGQAGQAKEDFMNMLEKNGHKLMNEYINAKTKVLIDFNCGHKLHWITPSDYKRGKRCPKCSRNCPEQAREEFLIMLERNCHKLKSEYANNSTKVLIDFNCGHEPHWIRPHDYKIGKGCPRCGVESGVIIKTNKSREEFLGMLLKNNHKLLSEYINTDTKVLIDFNCGHEPHWMTPDCYKRGHKCPKCKGVCSKQAREDFIDLIRINNHQLLTEYINVDTKVLINYNCGHEPHWITPYQYKKGVKCPRCSGNCTEQSREDLMNMLGSNNHKLLSEYINAQTKVLIDFDCGHQPHWIKPNAYKNGNRCPLCKNKGESFLYELLLDMGCEVERQKKYENLKDKDFLRYDFYLPKYNLLIELDGKHHYKPVPYITKDMTQQEKNIAIVDAETRFYDRQHKDKMKDKYAKNNNIPLLRIDYSDSKIELDKWKELILNKIKEIELIVL